MRKHVFYGILALVSLLGLGITQSARANLITNGGFETGDFSGWMVSGRDNDVVGSVPFISPHSGNSQALFGFLTNSIKQDVSVNLANVPDGGSTVSLLGLALLGVAVLLRFW